MNCKPRDIARIVSAPPPFQANLQKLVTVDYACPKGSFNCWHCTTLQPLTVDVWGLIVTMPAGESDLCMADASLRPLHDGDGVDETLLRVGKPQPRTVAQIRDDGRIVLLPQS